MSRWLGCISQPRRTVRLIPDDENMSRASSLKRAVRHAQCLKLAGFKSPTCWRRLADLTTVKVVNKVWHRIAINYRGVQYVEHGFTLSERTIDLGKEAVSRDMGRYLKAVSGDAYAKRVNFKTPLRRIVEHDAKVRDIKPEPLTKLDEIKLSLGIPSKTTGGIVFRKP